MILKLGLWALSSLIGLIAALALLTVIDPDEESNIVEVVVRYQANEYNESILIGVNAATWKEVILKPVEAMGIYILEGDNVPFTIEYRFAANTSSY